MVQYPPQFDDRTCFKWRRRRDDCCPFFTTYLIDWYGWRTSFLIIGIAVPVVIFIAAQFMRRDPESTGAVPYGESGRVTANGSTARGHSLHEALRTLSSGRLHYGLLVQRVLDVLQCTHCARCYQCGHVPTSAARILALTGALMLAGRIVLGTIATKRGTNRYSFFVSYSLRADSS